MAYASRAGRARVSASSPSAQAVCDRCGIWYNHRDLQFQMQWQGAALQNIRLLVCRECNDIPQQQLRAIALPGDPTPIINARTEAFLQDESNYRTVSLPLVTDPTTGLPIPSTTQLLSQSGQNMTTQPIGMPIGLDQDAQPPLYEGIHFGLHLSVLSVISNGTVIVTVTCSSAHNLVTNSQVSLEGLADNRANGFYSVTVLSATAFTYETNGVIPPQSLLQPTANIITVLVGLPRGYVQIPLTGTSNTLPQTMVFMLDFSLLDGPAVLA